MSALRHDWTLAEIEAIYTLPLTELVYRAAGVHRLYWPVARRRGRIGPLVPDVAPVRRVPPA